MAVSLPSQVMYDAVATAIGTDAVAHAVFTTFSFEPEHFELEILPVLFGIPLGGSPRVRRAQLEDALSSLRGHVSVFYDPSALSGERTQLDVSRVAVHHARGVFHPKLVVLLCEDPDGGQRVVCSVASANLTEAGWQRNLEAGHVLEIVPGQAHHAAAPLVRLLVWLKKGAAVSEAAATSLDEISWLLRTCDQPGRRRRLGRPLDQLWVGGTSAQGESLGDWLASRVARGSAVEVVSPFLDTQASAASAMVDALDPSEAVLVVPDELSQDALDAHTAVDGLRWGALKAGSSGRMGQAPDAAQRRVHAKVVRCRHPEGDDVVVVGSANLTTSAWSGRANVEAMVLTAVPPEHASPWVDQAPTPTDVVDTGTDELGTARNDVVPVVLTYDWTTDTLVSQWLEKGTPPALSVLGAGVELCRLPGGRGERRVRGSDHPLLRDHLMATLVVSVRVDDGPEGFVVVAETGRESRPSLFLRLSPAEVLAFWASLSPERRSTLLGDAIARLPREATDEGQDADLAPTLHASSGDSFFSRTAGAFHAFASFEKRVRALLEDGGDLDRRATELVLGEKFDSLGVYLDRVCSDGPTGATLDDVDRLVHVMCAKQVVDALRGDFPGFWSAHPAAATKLRARLSSAERVFDRVAADDPDLEAFLHWWRTHFLAREAAVP